MELLNCIKELLLLNDCVIIPEFGGFVTNYQPARIRSSTFQPPAKAIGFNKKLKFNDGLFINHVAEKEAINYIAARQKVNLLVQELNYRLEDGEHITIEGVGELFYDASEHLIFEPQYNSNLNLDSFGLSSFRFETLYAKKLSRKNIASEDLDTVEVIFQNRTLKKIMIGLPLVIALAFFPIKDNKENIMKSDMNVLTEMTTHTEPARKVEVIEKIVPEVETVQEHRYFLIGGSFRSDANAKRFVKQKQAEGFDAQNIGLIKGLNYISLGSFTDFTSAKAEQQKIKTKSPGSGVWIYVKK